MLYDALLALYEIFERWGLQGLLHHTPEPALWIAKALPAPGLPRTTTPWPTLQAQSALACFWRTLAASQSLDVDDMGPATTRRLQLRPDTSALNLLNVLATLQYLNGQGHIDYELLLDRSIEVIERFASGEQSPHNTERTS